MDFDDAPPTYCFALQEDRDPHEPGTDLVYRTFKSPLLPPDKKGHPNDIPFYLFPIDVIEIIFRFACAFNPQGWHRGLLPYTLLHLSNTWCANASNLSSLWCTIRLSIPLQHQKTYPTPGTDSSLMGPVQARPLLYFFETYIIKELLYPVFLGVLVGRTYASFEDDGNKKAYARRVKSTTGQHPEALVAAKKSGPEREAVLERMEKALSVIGEVYERSGGMFVVPDWTNPTFVDLRMASSLMLIKTFGGEGDDEGVWERVKRMQGGRRWVGFLEFFERWLQVQLD